MQKIFLSLLLLSLTGCSVKQPVIVVPPPNIQPSKPVVITLTLASTPLSGNTPLTVNFVATCTTCVAYTWSFGDGSIQTTIGPKQTHTYTSIGTFYPIVAAVDKKGNSATGTTIITSTQSCGKPTYPCVNRSTAAIPTPTTPPNAGGPGGANTYMIDPDFHNVLVRATDYTHTIDPSTKQWDGNYFDAGCGGGAFCHAVNADRTLWKIEGAGGNDYIIRFDPIAFSSAVQLIRAANNTIPTGLPQSVFGLFSTTPTGYVVPKGSFSWTQRNLYYAASGTKIQAYCFGTTYINAICSDTLATTEPTTTNGRIITLVDLANAGPKCLPSTYVPTWVAFGDQDEASDGVFSVAFSSKNEGYPGQTGFGQNTGVHLVIWTQNKGCQVVNTYTGLITADPAWETDGEILTLPDRFTIHTSPNVDLSGIYASLAVENCLSITCSNFGSGIALTLGTNEDFYLCAKGYGDCGGHSSFGWKSWQNSAEDLYPGQQDSRPLPNTKGTFIRSGSVKVTGITCHGDSHESWVADDPTNSTDWLSTSSISSLVAPVKVCNDSSPYRNEINLYDPKGGFEGRAGHTFNSGYSGRFSIQYAIFEWSQIGDFMALSSDWLETLGDENGNVSCPGGLFRFPNWKTNTSYAINTLLYPESGNAYGYIFKVIVAGTSGTNHPVWPQTTGIVITDGTQQLLNIGSGCRGDVFITDITTAY